MTRRRSKRSDHQADPLGDMIALGAGLAVGWGLLQAGWIAKELASHDVRHTLAVPMNTAAPGISFEREAKADQFTRVHQVKDGIEWISYHPTHPRYETPILMVHGMWHGAWCWQSWQEILAAEGWESHAISLPGHGLSPVQVPIARCTLDYYLSFVRDAVESLPCLPVLMGHSMGGALTQWYLRYVGNLPGAVLVAPWALYDGFMESIPLFWKLDPVGCLLTALTFRAAYVRTPERAANALLGPDAVVSPENLYNQLGPESVLVMFQHAIPWKIRSDLTTPIFYLSGEIDAVIPERAARRNANAYHADYVVVKHAAHNLMMEHNYRETADAIRVWLENKQLA